MANYGHELRAAYILAAAILVHVGLGSANLTSLGAVIRPKPSQVPGINGIMSNHKSRLTTGREQNVMFCDRLQDRSDVHFQSAEGQIGRHAVLNRGRGQARTTGRDKRAPLRYSESRRVHFGNQHCFFRAGDAAQFHVVHV